MKKLISLLAVAVISLVSICSCNKEQVADHSFFCVTKTNARAAAEINEIVAQDPYFSSVITKRGYFSQVCPQAIEEFKTHCDNLNAETIESKLRLDEVYRIEFWSMDPAQNWISYIFKNGVFTIE